MMPQSRTIAVKYHWFREQLSESTIVFKKIATEDQLANILTKALPRAPFEIERRALVGW